MTGSGNSLSILWNVFIWLIVIEYGECSCSKSPRVVIENGVVVGTHMKSHGGKSYQAFLGIPYAEPPLGKLRFEEPQRLTTQWIGEYNAAKEGSVCLQYDHLTRDAFEENFGKYTIQGDEDCLFLNVYTRDISRSNQDVIVVIHGGAFMFGTGTFYGADFLMDKENIVYVTINYRLGPLGFLSTGDSIVPGNNGLKDQVFALEWIQRNIAAFGGNPKSVTIAGLSAGGASVHYHYLSPLSRGLFHRGYSYSGTSLSSWAMLSDVPLQTFKLASLLGCSTSNTRVTVECLRQRPARQIVQQIENFKVWLYNPISNFGPMVEVAATRPFIDKSPINILINGEINDVPWINTVTREEGLYPGAEFAEREFLLKELEDRWDELAPFMLCFNDSEPGSRHLEISRQLKKIYLEDKPISLKTSQEVINMIGDGFFVWPAVQAAKLQAHANTEPVYFYHFRYRGSSSLTQFLAQSSNDLGVCHGDDIAYVTNMPHVDILKTESDVTIGQMLVDILTTFAKTGSPPKTLEWKRVSRNLDDDFEYLDIQSPDNIKMTINNELGKVKFWNDLFVEKKMTKEEL